jgi:hypothetical protein
VKKGSDGKNGWVSKPVSSWLRNTGRVGPFLGGGWVHSFPVVAYLSRRNIFETNVKAENVAGFTFSD